MGTLGIYKCPVCNKPLSRVDRTYICNQRHSYDISKDGYVNLLLANQMKSKEPGDSKEMMVARHSFLDKGYFKQLSDNINDSALRYMKAGDGVYAVLDAGCGEGYYTTRLYEALQGTQQTEMFGMDISKEAVRLAAKRNRNISYCVGSVFNLPILSRSVDGILNVFAPFKEPEFIRVLKEEGMIIKVTPGPAHLFGLKEALYDSPYLNEEEALEVKSLKCTEAKTIRYDIQIDDPGDIVNLLKMTPYYWNTNITRVQDFIRQATRLETALEFVISVYKKDK